MARLVRVETDYRYYAVELTEEQLKLYKEDEDAFWEDEEMGEELMDNMEMTRLKDGGTEYFIEE
jgi:hypothetical protein